MNPDSDARAVALAALAAVLDDGRSLSEAPLFAAAASDRDRAYARRLAFGVLRWLSALEWLAAALLDRPLRARDRDVHRLLLLGLNQLWHEGTADHAAVHATAECARTLGKPWAVGLVNAVLRRFQRERDALLERLERDDARFAHPAWLLEQLRRDWPERWPEIVAANNREPPLWLRCNARRIAPVDLERRLRDDGFTVTTHRSAPDALRIEPAVPVSDIPGFAEGLCSVQDPAAQLAARLLAPAPGQRVLDACAAPGGKTCHLLELEPELELTALDVQSDRVGLIEQNLSRLGLRARVLAADAARPEQWWDGRTFDRILLDAPCSATGVIRRHPEIKWLRRPRQVDAVVAMQRELLDALWPLLAPGGMLVYATCSVIRRENSEQIQRFLESHGDAEAARPEISGALAEPVGCQLLPGPGDTDGFFYSVLRRSA